MTEEPIMVTRILLMFSLAPAMKIFRIGKLNRMNSRTMKIIMIQLEGRFLSHDEILSSGINPPMNQVHLSAVWNFTGVRNNSNFVPWILILCIVPDWINLSYALSALFADWDPEKDLSIYRFWISLYPHPE